MDAAGGMNSCWPFQEHILQLTKLLLIFLPENLGGLTGMCLMLLCIAGPCLGHAAEVWLLWWSLIGGDGQYPGVTAGQAIPKLSCSCR